MAATALVIPGKKVDGQVILPEKGNLEAIMDSVDGKNLFLWDEKSKKFAPVKGRGQVMSRDNVKIYWPGAEKEQCNGLYAQLNNNGRFGRRISPNPVNVRTESHIYSDGNDLQFISRTGRLKKYRVTVQDYQWRNLTPESARHDAKDLARRLSTGGFSYPLIIGPKGDNSNNALAFWESPDAIYVNTMAELVDFLVRRELSEKMRSVEYLVSEFPQMRQGQMRIWLDVDKIISREPHPLDPYEDSLDDFEETVSNYTRCFRSMDNRGNSRDSYKAVDFIRLDGDHKAYSSKWIVSGVISSAVAYTNEFDPAMIGYRE